MVPPPEGHRCGQIRTQLTDYSCVIYRRIFLWSTVSKAFFTSRKMAVLIFPLFILNAQESFASSKAVTVE